MDNNQDFDDFSTIVDEFFTYPGPGPMMEEYNVPSMTEMAHSPLRDFSMDFEEYRPTTPSLSRSSSRSCDMIPSPIIDAAPCGSSPTLPVEMKSHWQMEGQIQFQKPITKKSFLSQQEKPTTGSSRASSPGSNESDTHHEGSCAKCRMTEAEARRHRLQRRREQNRASQRKFRARKEAKIREAASQVATLETYVEFLEKHNGDLEKTNARLRQRLSEAEQNKEQSTDRQINPSIRRPLTATPHRSSIPVAGHGKTSSLSNPTWTQASKADIGGLYLPLFDHDIQPPQANSLVTPMAS